MNQATIEANKRAMAFHSWRFSLVSRMKITIKKIVWFEFWPWWFISIPVLPVYFFSVLYTRKWLYFTAVNPNIEMGGFFGEKKNEIQDLIEDKYKPLEYFYNQRAKEDLSLVVSQQGFQFPIIVKPNVGERGNEVFAVSGLDELTTYASKGFDFLLQELVDLPLELGVLWHKMPGSNSSKVTSITIKKFMVVIGDGIHTVGQLVLMHRRYALYHSRLMREYTDRLNAIPNVGEKVQIHRIGNHCKGTQFINGNPYIKESINATFDQIGSKMEGVDYGRFDLKVPSWEDLEAGRGIKIFEMNGVSSEPGHMYDLPTVFHAFGSLYKHWWIIAQIAKKNIKKGVKTTPFNKFINQVKNHFTA